MNSYLFIVVQLLQLVSVIERIRGSKKAKYARDNVFAICSEDCSLSQKEEKLLDLQKRMYNDLDELLIEGPHGGEEQPLSGSLPRYSERRDSK